MASVATTTSKTTGEPVGIPLRGDVALLLLEERIPPTTVSVVDLVRTELDVTTGREIIEVTMELDLELVLKGVPDVDVVVVLVGESWPVAERVDLVVRETSLDVVCEKLAR